MPGHGLQRQKAQHARAVLRVGQHVQAHFKHLFQQIGLQHVVGRAFADQAALLHHGQPVAVAGLVEVVNGHDLGAGQAVNELAQRKLVVDVQVAAWFARFGTWGETAAPLLTFVLVTGSFILVADLMPKRLAMTYPEAVAVRIVRPMMFLIFLLKPDRKSNV